MSATFVFSKTSQRKRETKKTLRSQTEIYYILTEDSKQFKENEDTKEKRTF